MESAATKPRPSARARAEHASDRFRFDELFELQAATPQASRAPCTTTAYVVMKRAIDAPAALALLIMAAPALLLLAVLIRATSPGPVLFGHKRLGRHGRTFACYKFRTMFADAEQKLLADPELYGRYVANDYKLPDGCDPRITRVGAFLRRTSLDELPQLWNVLRGEMSLVGPRPIVPDELAWYGDRADELLTAFPGLTGRWQVLGRSVLGYPERVGVELAYVREWSFWRDVEFLFRTVPAVLSRRGAY